MVERCILIIAALSLVGIFLTSETSSAQKSLESINIIAGSTGGCGSHGGSFDATYEGRKIEIEFSYNSTPANPVVHPVKVYDGNTEAKNWDHFICMVGGPSPLSGKAATVEGRWSGKNTFEAYRIYIGQAQTVPRPSSTPAAKADSLSEEAKRIVPQTAKAYADQMMARCGDSTYFRQGNDIWELKGEVHTICCHEAPEILTNDPRGITWRGTIEVSVSGPNSRAYDPKNGWSKWGDDPPLLFTVYKQNGQWTAKGSTKFHADKSPQQSHPSGTGLPGSSLTPTPGILWQQSWQDSLPISYGLPEMRFMLAEDSSLILPEARTTPDRSATLTGR